MTAFKEWLVSVTATALLLAAADSLMPKGSVRRFGKFTAGLVLMIALVQPVMKMNYEIISEGLSRMRNDLEGYQVQPQNENFDLMKSIIEARTAAYIQNKAAQQGIVCRAEVIADAKSREAYPYPVAVTVVGELTEDEIGCLEIMIEGELAVPVEKQTYLQEENGLR